MHTKLSLGFVNLFFILIVGVILLFGGGIIFLSHSKSEVATAIITPTPMATVEKVTTTPIPVVLDDEQKWKIYQNTLYSLKYPSQLLLKEYKESTYSGIEISSPQATPEAVMNILVIKNSQQKALDLADSLRKLETGDPSNKDAIISDIYGGAVDGKDSFEYSVKRSFGHKLLTVVDVGNNVLLRVVAYTYNDLPLVYKDHELTTYILNNLRFE